MENISRTSPVHAVEKTIDHSVRKTHRLPFYVLGGLAIAVALGVAGVAIFTAGKESTDDAQVEADVVPVASRIGGNVLRVLVHENELVKKGQLLVQLDDADHAARLAQAEAELETAKAQATATEAQESISSAAAEGSFSSAQAALSGMSVQLQTADSEIAAATATLERARTEARKADLDLARAKKLRAAEAISQERLDNAQTARDVAEAALAEAQAKLAAAQESKRAAKSHVDEARGRVRQTAPIEAQIAVAHAQAELARARVKAAEAAVALAANQVSYTRITAPEDGSISKLGVHEGQLIQPGQPIGELVPAKTYVVANFKETQLERMRPGERAEVRIDAFPGQKLEGVVESLSGGTGARFSLLPPDNASGNFVKVVQRVPVRIAWEHAPDLPLRAGLSAEVTVHVSSKDGRH